MRTNPMLRSAALLAAVLALVSCTESATAPTVTPTTLAKVAGDNQTGVVNTALPTLFVATLLDENGVPIPGDTVTWAVSGGGTPAYPVTVTDAQGNARTLVQLGTVSGPQTVTAAAGAVSAVFSTTNQPGPAVNLIKVSGDQTIHIGNAVAPIIARTVDVYGNPVPNVSLSGWMLWKPGGTGMVITFGSFQTDANGNTTSTFTSPSANGVGSFEINVEFAGYGPFDLSWSITVN